MDLYLLRHGIAADRKDGDYEKDSDRPLTEEGISKMEEIAKAMIKLEISFDLILSSPYLRASQTAEVVARRLGLKKLLQYSNHLTCEGNPEKLIWEINRTFKGESLLLVGHEPYLSSLISVLTSGTKNGGFVLKKGGFCGLNTEKLLYKQCAEMQWLLTPKQMLKIAKV